MGGSGFREPVDGYAGLLGRLRTASLLLFDLAPRGEIQNGR